MLLWDHKSEYLFVPVIWKNWNISKSLHFILYAQVNNTLIFSDTANYTKLSEVQCTCDFLTQVMQVVKAWDNYDYTCFVWINWGNKQPLNRCFDQNDRADRFRHSCLADPLINQTVTSLLSTWLVPPGESNWTGETEQVNQEPDSMFSTWLMSITSIWSMHTCY